MRRLQAIALVIALVAAPMALFAGAWKCACAPAQCTIACCNHGKCVMQHHDQCQGSSMAFNCDCMRFPSFSMLAPLTQMILPHPVTMPAIERTGPESPALAFAVLPGFLPSPFHPPRG
ncbi:MAG: hypothetical protein KGL59_10915 [Acidobacteriota bacterium]|nr:hypothetical protein [Acidobacteriota bacterium]